MAKSNKVLKIGDKAQLYGVEIELKGFIRYRQRDDGDYYYWEDWYGLTKDGQQYWIDYDEYSQKYTFFKRIEFPEQGELDVQSIRDAASDQQIHFVESGSATVMQVDGDMPFAAKKGDSVAFIDAVGGQGLYSVENDGQLVRLYRGENIDEANLLEAFGHKVAADNLRKKRKAAIKWKLLDRVIIAMSLVLLILLGIALGGRSLLLNTKVSACLETEACSYDLNLSEPIQLSAWPGLYQVEASSLLPTPRTKGQEYWRQIVVEFLNEDQNVANGVLLENWSEYWVEGSESGREADLSDTSDLRVSEAGEYRLRAFYREQLDEYLKVDNPIVYINLYRTYLTAGPIFAMLVVVSVYGLVRLAIITKSYK